MWVAGYPSYYGGADTELDHQIDLWLSQGVAVHLVPDSEPDPVMKADVTARGAFTHVYRPDIFAGKAVVSFCNGRFLELLPEISSAGRPRCVVWINCMTWTFPRELECHRLGLIDVFGFQSQYQRKWLLPELTAIRPVEELESYRPFFSLKRWFGHSSALNTVENRAGYYGIGRVSRDDQAKYPADLWATFSCVTAPSPVKCFVLGWGPNALQKCGLPTAHNGLDWELWPPGGIPAVDFFSRIHTLIHQTGGSRENWPRVAFEAWASDVALLAECDYAWPELVDDGATGFLCRSSGEFADRASLLAFDEGRRRQMVAAGRKQLKREHCDDTKCFEAWDRIL